MESLRTLAGLSIAALALVGCGGSTSKPSEAFCNDLRAGYTPFQILAESVRDGTYSPQTAADRAYGFAAISCPEQLRSNESLRAYLESWNINPDV